MISDAKILIVNINGDVTEEIPSLQEGKKFKSVHIEFPFFKFRGADYSKQGELVNIIFGLMKISEEELPPAGEIFVYCNCFDSSDPSNKGKVWTEEEIDADMDRTEWLQDIRSESVNGDGLTLDWGGKKITFSGWELPTKRSLELKREDNEDYDPTREMSLQDSIRYYEEVDYLESLQ